MIPKQVNRLISHNVSLAAHTSLKIGGLARFYARPTSRMQLGAVIDWSRATRTPYCILGGGTNTLFTDKGFDGLVVHMRSLRGLRTDGVTLHSAAGEMLSRVAWAACEAGLTGLEWACGIPGTIGGAVVMNAGTREGEMANVIDSITLLDQDHRERVSKTALCMGYRTSALLTGSLPGVVVDVDLVLQRNDPRACIARARLIMTKRTARIPSGASAGCIFKNPSTGPTAGQLLEQVGCKGLRIGSAVVSNLHANFIINEGTGNAEDVLALIHQMRKHVQEITGITLDLEVLQY